MYYNVYGDNRVMIVCGNYETDGKCAVDYLYGALAAEVPYVLTVCEAEHLTKEQEQSHHIIAVGTKENNRYLKKLCDTGLLEVPKHHQGYRLKVFSNPENSDKQIYALLGATQIGAYYAVSRFVNQYLPENESKDLKKLRFVPLFTRNMKEVDWLEEPKIQERGIWTWGHVMYDYRRFLDHMARLRMNIITVWNDHAPINAKEFVDYAHQLGIKVIWGFSMGWGHEYDISNQNLLDEIIDKAMEHYAINYQHLGGDGIYFQTFTETEEESKNGMNIAKQVSVFVNHVNQRFKERFGDIRIQFGLHASSVKNHLDAIATIDKKLEITWEDCGCFPYEYTPENMIDFEQTRDLTQKITKLRGNDDRFSVVLKGLCCLEWDEFEYQLGRFPMGVYQNFQTERKYQALRKFWRRVNALWLKNGDKAQDVIEVIRKEKQGNTMIQALIEDGAFEEKINLSAAIMAELMWDSDKPFDDIVYAACLMPDIEL